MGSRLGWRWGDGQEEDDSVWDDDDCDDYVEFCARAGRGQCCEINWLDPEPSRLSNDYDIYINDIMDQTEADWYSGYYQPPTKEEYIDVCHELLSHRRYSLNW